MYNLDIEELKDEIIDSWFNGIDQKGLYRFYYDIQKEYLDELDDSTITEIATDCGLLEQE